MQNGMLISKLRVDHHKTVKEMARYLNIGTSPYKRYEASLKPMKIQELNALSNYFKVSLNTLLGLSDNMHEFGSFDIDYKYLRFSLRYIRRMQRITQKELAKDLNVSVPTVARYEKHPELLKVDYLLKFAKRFSISVDYICGKTLKKEVL